MVASLRPEQSRLEGDDLLSLFLREIAQSLRMTLGRIVRLVCEILENRCGRRRLPAIPHDGGQKAKIGGGQWSPVGRHAGQRRSAAIRIVHAVDGELRIGWEVEADADQA